MCESLALSRPGSALRHPCQGHQWPQGAPPLNVPPSSGGALRSLDVKTAPPLEVRARAPVCVMDARGRSLLGCARTEAGGGGASQTRRTSARRRLVAAGGAKDVSPSTRGERRQRRWSEVLWLTRTHAVPVARMSSKRTGALFA